MYFLAMHFSDEKRRQRLKSRYIYFCTLPDFCCISGITQGKQKVNILHEGKNDLSA
jgi:hypothetical protein